MIHAVAFGKTLTLCRKWFNLSQNDVAQLLGVTNQAVSKWELGNSTPNITILWMISEIFFVDIKMLITHSNEIEKHLQSESKNSNYFVKRNTTLSFIPSYLTRSFFFNCISQNLKLKSIKTSKCIYAESTFSDISIFDSHLDCTNFTNCRFQKIILENNAFTHMRLISNLITFDIKKCNFENSILNSETFQNSQLVNCKISQCSCNKTIFTNCIFDKINFDNCIFFNSTFHKCTFTQVVFNSNTCNKCNFTNCNFDDKTLYSLKQMNVNIANSITK